MGFPASPRAALTRLAWCQGSECLQTSQGHSWLRTHAGSPSSSLPRARTRHIAASAQTPGAAPGVTRPPWRGAGSSTTGGTAAELHVMQGSRSPHPRVQEDTSRTHPGLTPILLPQAPAISPVRGQVGALPTAAGLRGCQGALGAICCHQPTPQQHLPAQGVQHPHLPPAGKQNTSLRN